MQKAKLNRFIQKYNLGGNVNSVKWKSDGDKLSTTFVTPDKSLLGTVNVDKFQFEDVELGVYQTDLLKNLLGVLDDDLSLTLSRFGDKAVALKAKNGSVSVDYVLSDLSVIADPPELKRLPDFGTQIKLDSKFIMGLIFPGEKELYPGVIFFNPNLDKNFSKGKNSPNGTRLTLLYNDKISNL